MVRNTIYMLHSHSLEVTMRKLSWKRILLIVLCAMFVLGGVLTFFG